jgi:hypothetical protein
LLEKLAPTAQTRTRSGKNAHKFVENLRSYVYPEISLSLSPARQRLRSRTVKSAKQDLETDAEGKQRVVDSGERTSSSSSSSSSSRKNLAQYSTISCEKKEAILDSGLRGPLKTPVGLELLNCESRDDNKTHRHAGDTQCKKLQ